MAIAYDAVCPHPLDTSRPLPEGEVFQRRAAHEEEEPAASAVPLTCEEPVASGIPLTVVGDRVPSRWLPTGDWIPLTEWLRIELPVAWRCSNNVVQPVELSLVRCFQEAVPNLLITETALFAEYVATAPSWRLERLAFAANDLGRVLVRGTPLLPIPGQQWVERDGIATLAGWTWTPAIDANILRRKFGLQTGDLALLEASRLQKIPAANWVQLTRSAVRATMEAKDAF